jgi:hypothetical protein
LSGSLKADINTKKPTDRGIIMRYLDEILKPTKIDKNGPMYTKDDVDKASLGVIKSGAYFHHKSGHMMSDTEKAIEKVETVTEAYSKAISKFVATETNIMESSKKVSQSLRQSTEKLSNGLARIEKTANFENLERYVSLLERANAAISSLAELEKMGKLELISKALK